MGSAKTLRSGPSVFAICPQKSGFGAEINGVDLSRPLAAETLDRVRLALASYGVVWFPEQHLDHDELEAFTLQFGEFGDNPYVESLPGRPNVVEVRRDPGETVAVFGGGWHSDWSFQEVPPSATILHAKVVPPDGGDTLFADTAGAYAALSPGFHAILADLRAVHTAAGPYGSNGYFSKETGRTGMQIVSSREADRRRSHPLTPIHPVTGRRTLFVNPGYTAAIEGLSENESAAILGFLFGHITSERFTFSHSWRAGMLTMWDNRSVLHCATAGYDGQLRLMHRTVVAGSPVQ